MRLSERICSTKRASCVSSGSSLQGHRFAVWTFGTRKRMIRIISRHCSQGLGHRERQGTGLCTAAGFGPGGGGGLFLSRTSHNPIAFTIGLEKMLPT